MKNTIERFSRLRRGSIRMLTFLLMGLLFLSACGERNNDVSVPGTTEYPVGAQHSYEAFKANQCDPNGVTDQALCKQQYLEFFLITCTDYYGKPHAPILTACQTNPNLCRSEETIEDLVKCWGQQTCN